MTSTSTNRNQLSKLALASAVASRVEMVDLHQCSASYTRIDDLSSNPTELLSKTHTITKQRIDNLQIEVTVHCSVRAETAEQKEFINIESRFAVTYKVPSFEELTEEHIDAFGEVNGTYNVWPYWREFVQNATMRMGLTPLTLPVYRPRERHGAKHQSSTARPEAASAPKTRTNRQTTKRQKSAP